MIVSHCVAHAHNSLSLNKRPSSSCCVCLVSSRLESTGKSRCMSLLLVPAILRFGIGFLDPLKLCKSEKQ